MSDKYAALRAAAEAATGAHERLSVIPADEIFDISLADATQLDADITALNAFNELANPATMLSLLAEREADKARIAELEAALKKESGYASAYEAEKWHYHQLAESEGQRSESAEQRIAELESRKVQVSLPDCDFGAVQHISGGSDDYCNGFVDGTQNAIKRFTADCAAAGITLETGERP